VHARRALLVLSAVSGLAACDVLKSATQPSSTVSATTVGYTAIGSSDAAGVGGSVPCVPFTVCPDGTGYVPVVVRRLQAAGKTVTLMNLGIPGAVLGPDTQAMGNSLGRGIPSNFLDNELPFVPHETTVVTIFAGGNDANTMGAALDAGLGGADPTSWLQTQTQNFGRDLRTLVAGIRSRAPQARIVILNLPNLAALPYAAGDTLVEKHTLQRIAVALSAQVNALVSQGVLVVDLMCNSRIYQASAYSGDGFHPNDAGYSSLADVIYPAVATGASTAPSASCGPMTTF
jgi:lysophospholipase L1-like esterase